jgi:hypothetical protein
LGICPKWIVSQKELVVKASARIKIKENEIISWGYAILKRKTAKITWKFFKVKWITKEKDCITFLEIKVIDWEENKIIKIAIS